MRDMNTDRLYDLANRYRHLRIGVVGDFFLDRYLHIDATKSETSIETGLPVHNVVAVRSQPGAAGTILNNLVALEVGAIHAVGYCGDDGEGYELRRALANLRGVSIEHLVTSSSRLTPVYCKPLLIEPGRLPRELNRLDTKNWSRTPSDLERDLADRVGKLASKVDVLLLLDQVEIPETGVATGVVRDAVHVAMRERSGLMVLADSRQGLHNFPPVGFKMNAAELGRMTQSSSTELEAVKTQAAVLAKSTGQPVFVTLAERGIVGVFPGQSPDYVPAYPVRGPIDVVGAGDAVMANLAAALAAGASPREAMELAMAAASFVIHQLDTTGTASIRQIASLLPRATE
jgi:rfaE bifunctional protein kinase chain/domain